MNNLRLVYFIFRLKNLPEYSNHGNINSKFKNCNYTMTYPDIFWEYYFQLRTIFSYKQVWMTWLGIFFSMENIIVMHLLIGEFFQN